MMHLIILGLSAVWGGLSAHAGMGGAGICRVCTAPFKCSLWTGSRAHPQRYGAALASFLFP